MFATPIYYRNHLFRGGIGIRKQVQESTQTDSHQDDGFPALSDRIIRKIYVEERETDTDIVD